MDRMPHKYPSVHRAVRTTDRMYTTTILVSGNCHSRNSVPIPVAAPTNTNAQSSPRRVAFFKNLVFVTAASLLPLFTGNYSPFAKGKQGKTVLIKVGSRKAIRRIAQPQSEGLRSPGFGTAPQQAENHPFRESGMDGFSHLYYRCIACHYYQHMKSHRKISAFGTIVYRKPNFFSVFSISAFLASE